MSDDPDIINTALDKAVLDCGKLKGMINGTDTESVAVDDGTLVPTVRKLFKHLKDTYDAKEAAWELQIQNLIATINANPSSTVGQISAFPLDTSPPGWLKCNGASVLRTSYPALYNYLQTTFGAEDNNHFSLIDLRGYFLRGIDDGAGRNPDPTINNIINTAGTQQDDSIITLSDKVCDSPAFDNNHFSTNNTYLFKKWTQTDASIFMITSLATMGYFNAPLADGVLLNSMATTSNHIYDTYSNEYVYGNSIHMNTSRKGPRYGQPETRPKNISVNWCIKY